MTEIQPATNTPLDFDLIGRSAANDEAVSLLVSAVLNGHTIETICKEISAKKELTEDIARTAAKTYYLRLRVEDCVVILLPAIKQRLCEIEGMLCGTASSEIVGKH